MAGLRRAALVLVVLDVTASLQMWGGTPASRQKKVVVEPPTPDSEQELTTQLKVQFPPSGFGQDEWYHSEPKLSLPWQRRAIIEPVVIDEALVEEAKAAAAAESEDLEPEPMRVSPLVNAAAATAAHAGEAATFGAANLVVAMSGGNVTSDEAVEMVVDGAATAVKTALGAGVALNIAASVAKAAATVAAAAAIGPAFKLATLAGAAVMMSENETAAIRTDLVASYQEHYERNVAEAKARRESEVEERMMADQAAARKAWLTKAAAAADEKANARARAAEAAVTAAVTQGLEFVWSEIRALEATPLDPRAPETSRRIGQQLMKLTADVSRATSVRDELRTELDEAFAAAEVATAASHNAKRQEALQMAVAIVVAEAVASEEAAEAALAAAEAEAVLAAAEAALMAAEAAADAAAAEEWAARSFVSRVFTKPPQRTQVSTRPIGSHRHLSGVSTYTVGGAAAAAPRTFTRYTDSVPAPVTSEMVEERSTAAPIEDGRRPAVTTRLAVALRRCLLPLAALATLLQRFKSFLALALPTRGSRTLPGRRTQTSDELMTESA